MIGNCNILQLIQLIDRTNLQHLGTDRTISGLIEPDKQLLHVDRKHYAVGKHDQGLQPVIKPAVSGIHHCGMGWSWVACFWWFQRLRWHGQAIYCHRCSSLGGLFQPWLKLLARGLGVMVCLATLRLAKPLPLTTKDLVVGDFDWTKMAQLGLFRVKPFQTEFPPYVNYIE